MRPIETVLERLNQRFPDRPPKRSGSSWESICPAHEGDSQSLTVSESTTGNVLLKCWSRDCTAKSICDALKVEQSDLFCNENGQSRATGNGKPKTPFPTIDGAIAAYRFGQPSNIWKYHDSAGNVVGAVLRWNRDDGKEIRPLRHDNGNWYLEGMSKPRPLYRLPDVQDAGLVAVTEGEKCADAARSIGLVGTTPPHGSKSPHFADWRPLAGKSVWVFPDNDQSGEQYVEAVLRLLGNLDPMPTVRVIRLPGLDDGEDLYDFVERHDAVAPESLLEQITAIVGSITVADLQSSPEPTRNPQIASHDGGPAEKAIPTIILSGNLREDSNDAWQAIHQSNEPPRLFRHGGVPARIEHDDSGTPIIKVVDQDRLRHFLARAADWKKVRQMKNHVAVSEIGPPMSVVHDVLATPDMPLPIVTRIVETPIFAEDGSLQNVPGYQPASKTFYVPQDGLKIPNVGDSPSEQAVQEAVSLIVHDLLFDFPFNGDAERATAISLLLLPFARELIDGATPLHLFEKPSPGTGATLMVDMLTYPATGRPIAGMTEGNSEDEWRKRITAKLMTGPQFLLIDNLQRRLDSAAVSSAITAPAWEDRILGGSTIVNLPVRCAWIATGNNPAVSSEIARRTVRCRLDTKEDRPWLRGGFKHKYLRTWAQQNRGQLIWAALTIIKSWIVAGRPLATTKLGMFESWSAVMGGILGHAGIDAFLGNLAQFYDESDAEGEQWRMLLVAWWTEHANRPATAGDLFPLAEQCDMTISGNTERAQRTRFGMMLGQQRDRTFTISTDDGTLSLRVKDAGKRSNAKQWQLEVND